MPYSDKQDLRDYQRQWIAKRRAAFFNGKHCGKCKSDDRLELDHIDSRSKARISDHSIWSWSEARREAEISKCQILCHECHLKKTIEFDLHRTSHGKLWMYTKHKCRCDICVAAKRLDIRKQKERKLARKAGVVLQPA